MLVKRAYNSITVVQFCPRDLTDLLTLMKCFDE